jgi:hypothetical protein
VCQTAEEREAQHSIGGEEQDGTVRGLPATSYAATALMNSSPLPVADTAHVRSFAYVPAPMMEVSPVS